MTKNALQASQKPAGAITEIGSPFALIRAQLELITYASSKTPPTPS